jgi:hypothetical protein
MIYRPDVLTLGSYRELSDPDQRGIRERGRALLTWGLVAVITVAFAVSITMLVLGWSGGCSSCTRRERQPAINPRFVCVGWR